MKVVVNRCYGGFGLSPLAQQEYLKLKKNKIFFYKQTKHKYTDGVDEYVRLDDVENIKEFFCTSFTKDFGETFTPSKEDMDFYWYYGDIERNDKDLVKVVEKLGEKANGERSKLEVVEVPDDVRWVIDDYDGMESVEERHRSW